MHDELDPASDDVEGHRLSSNENQVVVTRPATADEGHDEDDVEAHRLASNDNEIVVSPAPSSGDDPEGS